MEVVTTGIQPQIYVLLVLWDLLPQGVTVFVIKLDFIITMDQMYASHVLQDRTAQGSAVHVLAIPITTVYLVPVTPISAMESLVMLPGVSGELSLMMQDLP